MTNDTNEMLKEIEEFRKNVGGINAIVKALEASIVENKSVKDLLGNVLESISILNSKVEVISEFNLNLEKTQNQLAGEVGDIIFKLKQADEFSSSLGKTQNQLAIEVGEIVSQLTQTDLSIKVNNDLLCKLGDDYNVLNKAIENRFIDLASELNGQANDIKELISIQNDIKNPAPAASIIDNAVLTPNKFSYEDGKLYSIQELYSINNNTLPIKISKPSWTDDYYAVIDKIENGKGSGNTCKGTQFYKVFNGDVSQNEYRFWQNPLI